MSETKKIFKAKSQLALAQYWARGENADLNLSHGLVQLREGTITAKTQSYDWNTDRWIDDQTIVLAYTNDEGERVVYNYTAQDMADTYLRMQRPNKWNNGQPRYPHLVYAQIGKGKVLQGVSASFIYKLVEQGKATKILLPPDS